MQAKQMRNSAQLMEYLTQTHGISQTIIDDVYGYAKDNYEIGNYDECFEWYVVFLSQTQFSFRINVTPNFRLGKFIQLAPPNHKHALDAIWGRLASAICSEQFDAAHEAMTQLRENIDQTGKIFVLKSKFCQGFCLKFGRAKQYVKYTKYCITTEIQT